MVMTRVVNLKHEAYDAPVATSASETKREQGETPARITAAFWDFIEKYLPGYYR